MPNVLPEMCCRMGGSCRGLPAKRLVLLRRIRIGSDGTAGAYDSPKNGISDVETPFAGDHTIGSSAGYRAPSLRLIRSVTICKVLLYAKEILCRPKQPAGRRHRAASCLPALFRLCASSHSAATQWRLASVLYVECLQAASAASLLL